MLNNKTKIIQHQLADYCKSKTDVQIPGTKQNRLHHYKRLIYNIIDDAIESAYPIARSILSDEQWKKMIDAFVAEHNCKHPQLFRMPEEIIEFAIEKNYANSFKIPHLIDVLQFEWAEVEIHSMKDEEIPKINPVNDLLNSTLQFSPYCQLLALEYPVHQLKKIDVVTAKGEYFMLVYREESGTVQYLELTALTHYLLAQLSSGEITLKSTLDSLLEAQNNPNHSEWYAKGISFLNEMQSINVLLS